MPDGRMGLSGKKSRMVPSSRNGSLWPFVHPLLTDWHWVGVGVSFIVDLHAADELLIMSSDLFGFLSTRYSWRLCNLFEPTIDSYYKWVCPRSSRPRLYENGSKIRTSLYTRRSGRECWLQSRSWPSFHPCLLRPERAFLFQNSSFR